MVQTRQKARHQRARPGTAHMIRGRQFPFNLHLRVALKDVMVKRGGGKGDPRADMQLMNVRCPYTSVKGVSTSNTTAPVLSRMKRGSEGEVGGKGKKNEQWLPSASKSAAEPLTGITDTQSCTPPSAAKKIHLEP